jgi:hypothetical protein
VQSCLRDRNSAVQSGQVTDPLTAELAYVEARATRARAVGLALVVPLRLAGTADLGGAVAVLLIGRDHLLTYFVPAYVLVLVLGVAWYRDYARRHGVWLPVRPWVLIIVPTLVASATLSRLGFALDRPLLQVVGPGLANAAAVAVTGGWLRSSRLVFTGLAMALATGVAAALSTGDRAVSLELLAYGLLLWNASRGSR